MNIIRKLDRYRRLVLTGRMRWRVAVGIVHSAAVLFGSPASISAQTTPSGLFIESAPVRLTATYEEWIARAYPTAARELPDAAPDMKKVGAYFTPDLYQSLNGANDVVANRIVYLSDGLKIHGFEVRPRISVPPPPIIIWCRGGIGDVGVIRAGDLMIMAQWARRGFIVLATQYRGAAGSEGKDEYGGKDVDDVLTLVQLAHRLPNADHENVFLYGLSRGGMEVYEAIAAGADVRAAVVNSGISDLATVNDRRPDRKEMEALLAAAIPNFAEERRKGFESRSAIRWASKLTVPLLILHGTADWRVPADQALNLALRLQATGGTYSLTTISAGTHVELTGDQKQVDNLVLKFFRSYRHESTLQGPIHR